MFAMFFSLEILIFFGYFIHKKIVLFNILYIIFLKNYFIFKILFNFKNFTFLNYFMFEILFIL